MSLDPARADEAYAWLAKAAQDLRAADVDLAAVPPLTEDAAFHAQQAAEKSLKAILALHDMPIRKTHDLVGLGAECVAVDPTLEPLLRRAGELTEFAWRFRYPGPSEGLSSEEAVEALSVAREVHKRISVVVGSSAA
jgi:HEPN domain-containing protein